MASKKLGGDIDLNLVDCDITSQNGKRKAYIIIGAETDKENLKKIFKNIKQNKK